MMAFLALLFAALGGYAGFGPWALALSGLALLAIYQLEFTAYSRRDRDFGAHELTGSIAAQSLSSTLVTFGGAYAIGLLFRII